MKPAAEVRTTNSSYPIYIEPGCLERVGQLLAAHDVGRSAFVVTDASVAQPWGSSIVATLAAASFTVHEIQVVGGETAKSWDGASAIFDRLVEARAERRDTVLAVGGGVIGDLAGFVAATYLRGLNLVQVPTSLLAMADAAIGGKTAINHPRGKNLIGAFYQPLFALEDPLTLRSIPDRAFREGWAEIIKHGLIADPVLLSYLRERSASLQARQMESLTQALVASARVKATIVSEDEREADRRMWLNYGHTVAHALEAATEYRQFLHGEAVSIGLVAAAEVGRRLGLLQDDEVSQHREALAAFDLPLSTSSMRIDVVLESMTLDKKRRDARQSWVLLDGLANPIVRTDVPDEAVREALAAVGIE